MNKPILILLFFLSSLTINSVMASVTVYINDEQYKFTHEPRLVEVLAPIQKQVDWYWPGAALYETDNTQLKEIRQSLINNLSTLIDRYKIENPKLAKSLEHLQLTIAGWRLAKRLPIKIDYDLARLASPSNPLLPNGEYILSIATRKNTIELFGAIRTTVNVPHLNHADVSEYITEGIKTDLSDKDYVIIIQADGRNTTVPIAYWNKAHQEAMPGSQIFIPFKQSLFKTDFVSINQQIITLALNRLQ